MIEIDGSQGEGGGQVLRTALSLSLLTGKPFHLSKIRAGRPKPGLMRQHLTSIEAAVKISGAKTKGVLANSQEIFFEPGAIQAGDYFFAIGTAGSTTLVLQTILFPLFATGKPSTVIIEGGTHNPASPPFDFLERTFAPILRRHNLILDLKLERHGFYPAGGGRIVAHIIPGPKFNEASESSTSLSMIETTTNHRFSATAIFANLATHIPKRELDIVREKLDLTEDRLKIREVVANGPGNALLIDVVAGNTVEVFTRFAEKNISAERVAGDLIREVMDFVSSQAPVGPHLADQLLLVLAYLGKGEFLTGKPTRHTITNKDIINLFVEKKMNAEKIDDQKWIFRL